MQTVETPGLPPETGDMSVLGQARPEIDLVEWHEPRTQVQICLNPLAHQVCREVVAQLLCE